MRKMGMEFEKAFYLPARKTVEVLEVQKNGVRIRYWGCGLKEGQQITKRVSLKDLQFSSREIEQ